MEVEEGGLQNGVSIILTYTYTCTYRHIKRVKEYTVKLSL